MFVYHDLIIALFLTNQKMKKKSETDVLLLGRSSLAQVDNA